MATRRTLVDFGGDEDDKHLTTYFRHEFELDDPAAIRSLHLALVRDDGAVVYLNGEEIARHHAAEGLITHETPATDFTANDVENVPEEIDPADATQHLVVGRNVIAVEIHQVEPASSDLSFDLEVKINAPEHDPLAGMDPAELDEILNTPLP